jgi:hypothetical protein
MICSAKPVLTEERIFNNMLYVRYVHILDERPNIFIRDEPIFSSERRLRKDYYRKSSVGEKISGHGSQGA